MHLQSSLFFILSGLWKSFEFLLHDINFTFSSVNSILYCHPLWILMCYTAFLISLQFFLNGFTFISSHLILFSSLSSNCFLLLFHLGHCWQSALPSNLWSLLSFTKQCFAAILPLLFIGHYTGRYLSSPGVCSELLLIHIGAGFRWRAGGQVELNCSQANFQCDFHFNISFQGFAESKSSLAFTAKAFWGSKWWWTQTILKPSGNTALPDLQHLTFME